MLTRELWTAAAVIAAGALAVLIGMGAAVAVVAGALGLLLLLTIRDRSLGFRLAALSVFTVAMVPMLVAPVAVRTGALLGVAGLAAVIVARRGFPKIQGKFLVLLVGYLAVTTLATFSAGDPDAYVRLWIHVAIMLAFFALGASVRPGETSRLVRVILLVAVGQALYTVAEVAFGLPVLWASAVPEAVTSATGLTRLPNELIADLPRAQGTFGHPLLLAFYLVVALALGLRYEWKSRAGKAAFVVTMLVGVSLTGSRSALVIVLVALLLAVGSRRFALLRAAVIGVLGLFALEINGFFETDLVSRFVGGGSVTHRAGAIEAVPRLLDQPLFNVMFGHGWFSTLRLTRANLLQLDGFVAVDNQFVATLASSGVVGLALLTALVAVAYFRAGPQLRLAVGSVLLTFLVFDVAIYPSTAAMLSLLVGLTARSGEERGDGGVAEGRVDRADDPLSEQRH